MEREFETDKMLIDFLSKDKDLDNVKSLYLFGEYITKIPKEINKLISLESITLSNTSVAELPKEICDLLSLRSLYLSYSSITQLPKEIGKLTSLKNLDLSYSSISELPKEIGQLNSLEYLNLANSHITELPIEMEDLTWLRTLFLSATKLTEFPKCIFGMQFLENLDLNNVCLKKIPQEIHRLTSIIQLNLSETGITALPNEICNLVTLQGLTLSFNGIRRLPKQIKKLTGLISLDLHFTSLEKLQIEIFKLTSLESLDFSKTKIAEIPKEISELNSLRYLYFNNTLISELPKEIVKLKNLVEMDAKYLNLKTLPIEFADFHLNFTDRSTDNGINIDNTIIEGMDNQFLIASNQYIKQVYQSTMGVSNDLKVIVLGEGDAGKTSFIKSLKGLEFSDEPRTHGIEKTDLNNIHFWDFGGQEIYNSLHSLFMRNKALYIIVLNGRSDEKPTKWLNYIRTFADSNKSFENSFQVLIIINKVDDNNLANINDVYFKYIYPEVNEVYLYSCKEHRIDFITSKYVVLNKINEIQRMEYYEISLPEKVISLKSKIESLTENYISSQKWNKICDELSIPLKPSKNEPYSEQYLSYLDRIGLIYYGNDDFIILNVEWFLEIIYFVLNNPNAEFRQSGLIDEIEYADLLRTKVQERELDMFFKFVTQDKLLLATKIEDKFFFPSVLNKSATTNVYSTVKDFKKICFRYNYLPQYILKKLMVKLYNYIPKDEQKRQLWYYGFSCIIEDTYFIIIEEENDIAVYFDGNKLDAFTELIKEVIEVNKLSNINQKLSIVHYDLSIKNWERFYSKLDPKMLENIDFKQGDVYMNISNGPNYGVIGNKNKDVNITTNINNENKNEMISELEELKKLISEGSEKAIVEEAIKAVDEKDDNKVKELLLKLSGATIKLASSVGTGIVANYIYAALIAK